MSGHNKWSSIKHKKGALDKKRAKIFTKVIRELTAAVKLGGANFDANPRLKQAIILAKSVNMPSDTVQKTIKRADGNTDTTNYEIASYEGLGPQNIAVIIECLTDNKNRTIASIRAIFNKRGGTLGVNNFVKYLFNEVGLIEITKDKVNEEKLAELLIAAGGEDYKETETSFELYTSPKNLHQVYAEIAKSFEVLRTELCFLPQNLIVVDDLEAVNKILIFLEALEDNEDIQKVHTNFQPSQKILAKLAQNDS